MITILCTGSRGDFQPYLALAQELKALGREVRIAGGQSFEAFIKGYGIDFYRLSQDYQSADLDPQLLTAAQSSDNPLKMLLTFNKMKKYVLELTAEMYQACVGSELIIYHPGAAIGYFAGEMLGIPTVLAAPFPMHHTREVASVIAYGKNPMPVNFSYTLLQGLLWTAAKTGITTFFKAQSGKLPPNFGCPFERVDSRHPAIISCSNYVFPRPRDWNEHIHQLGYWFVRESDYQPPKALTDFLDGGDKPVYLGFGSVFNPAQQAETVALFTAALKQCGKRGIISGMGQPTDLPETILAVDAIPHSWLFEQVAAVCHHGGAGTTAAGFKAGVPSVVIPFSIDQFAWAHRAEDLGVGAKPVYHKNLTAPKLAQAIEAALQPEIVAGARALGDSIGSEQGARDCARLIVDRLLR
jgi:sterol 3beta-glucosyltransferase